MICVVSRKGGVEDVISVRYILVGLLMRGLVPLPAALCEELVNLRSLRRAYHVEYMST